ncbi:MAG TPA: TlpA disulfide reductase family protein [Pedobacter sp.]
MKITRLTLILIVLSGSVFAQTADKQVVFKGTTDITYNGNVVVLYNKITGDHDSAIVANGRFEIAVPYKEPGRYMFYSKYELKKKGGYNPFGIIITKPGTVQLKADMESFANSVVTANPENELYLAFIKEGMPARQQVIAKMTEKYGADFTKHLNQKDPLYAEVNQYYNGLNEAFNKGQVERLGNFIHQHPDSFTGMLLLDNMITIVPVEDAQLYYSKLGKSYKNTSYALNIQKTIDAKKVTAIGKIAPDFEQPDTTGKMVKLSDFRGQYVLVDFWASWCGPCRAENPNVVKAYNSFHDKGFAVLGVSLDQPGKKAAWLNAIHQDKLTWTQVSDLQFWNNAVAKLYGIRAIPQNFLLDKEGKIIAVNIKGEELNKKLLEIFD